MNHQTPLDRLFQALSDGHRRAMVDRLSAGPLSVSDLALPLDLSLPAALQHLSVLEGAGLIATEKRGRARICTLQPAALSAAETWFNTRRRQVEDRLARLDRHLSQTRDTE